MVGLRRSKIHNTLYSEGVVLESISKTNYILKILRPNGMQQVFTYETFFQLKFIRLSKLQSQTSQIKQCVTQSKVPPYTHKLVAISLSINYKSMS
jgi:hypothetical protein